MSGYQPFLIASMKVGLERDIEPWLLPNDGFPQLLDCYLWRGRIKKKQGFQLLGRLQRALSISGSTSITLTQTTSAGATTTITDLLNDASVVVTPAHTVRSVVPSAQIVPASLTISVNGGAVTFVDNGAGVLVGTPGTNSGTVNYITGQVVLTFNPINPGGQSIVVSLSYFPNLPVMGLRTLNSTTFNTGLLIAFDTMFSYEFNTSSMMFIDESFYEGTNIFFTWTGSDSDFFWTTNYANALWVTNFIPGFQSNERSTIAGNGDGIKWFDQSSSGFTNYLPAVDASNFLMGALMIIPYRGHLLALNTWEGPNYAGRVNFPQRARWSAIGTPYYSDKPNNYQGGTNVNAWRSDIAGNGDFIDAPTLETIVTAEFIKDVLVVYFTNSTWKLSYTYNDTFPFIWERVNVELGSASTFSEVPFDRGVLAFGNVGIHTCDSVNVSRIDQKIPDEIFDIQNENNGRKRVYGIRDFYNQLVYWTFPYVGPDDTDATDDEEGNILPLTYPNRIIVYNYVDDCYSFFKDSFTCFGYYQKAADTLWSNVTQEWQDCQFPWFSPINQELFPFIVAGNQVGFVEIFDPDLISNGPSLYISAITAGTPTTQLTVPNHNLAEGQFIRIVSSSGVTFPAGVGPTFKIFSVIDANNFTIPTLSAPTGTFTGSGTIATVSNIKIVTKRFNEYIQTGSQVKIGYADLYFDTTKNGSVTVNLFLDEDDSIPVNINNNTVNTFPESTYSNDDNVIPFQDAKLWKRIYLNGQGQLFEMEITLSDAQMMSDNIQNSQIVLHGIILWISKAGRLINV